MKHLFTSCAALALAMPAVAGSPFTWHSVEASSRAVAGTNSESLDQGTLPGFFGSFATFAESHWVSEWDEHSDATAQTQVSITGSASQWRIEANGGSESRVDDLTAEGRARFEMRVGFDMLAGQELVLAGYADGGGFGGPSGGWGGGVSVTIFRNGAYFADYQYEEKFNTTVDVSVLEAVGASYELRISGGGSSRADVDGASWSGGGFIMDIDVSIVPAPVSAAPLAMAGVALLRRRR